MTGLDDEQVIMAGNVNLVHWNHTLNSSQWRKPKPSHVLRGKLPGDNRDHDVRPRSKKVGRVCRICAGIKVAVPALTKGLRQKPTRFLKNGFDLLLFAHICRQFQLCKKQLHAVQIICVNQGCSIQTAENVRRRLWCQIRL